MDDRRSKREGGPLSRREAILVTIWLWLLRLVFGGWTLITAYLLALTDCPHAVDGLVMGLVGFLIVEMALAPTVRRDIRRRKELNDRAA